MFVIQGESDVTVLTADQNNLAVVAVKTAGAPGTTANVYAVGCEVTDKSTGIIYTNCGTSAVPAWTGRGSVVKSLTAAELIAMYAAPVAVVPAIAGKAIFVDSVSFVITRTSTAFTGGGVVALQYAATANGAGTLTHATIAATVVTGAAGTTFTDRVPAVAGQSDIASASIVGIGLYISNATAAFAAGTGTAVMTVNFHVV